MSMDYISIKNCYFTHRKDISLHFDYKVIGLSHSLLITALKSCKTGVSNMEIKQDNYEENLKRANITLEKMILIYEEQLKSLKKINELQDNYISRLEDYNRRLENFISSEPDRKKIKLSLAPKKAS